MKIGTESQISPPCEGVRNSSPPCEGGGGGGRGGVGLAGACHVAGPSEPPCIPPSKGGREFRRQPAQQFQDEWKPRATPSLHHPNIAVREPVAVVTGASSGIGRALALELACRGYQVGLVARRRNALEDLACEIDTRGGRAQVAAADVGDRQALHAAIQEIECAFGPVDVIVANAGFGVPTQLAPLNITDVEADLPREPAGRRLLDRGRAAGHARPGSGTARGRLQPGLVQGRCPASRPTAPARRP